MRLASLFSLSLSRPAPLSTFTRRLFHATASYSQRTSNMAAAAAPTTATAPPAQNTAKRDLLIALEAKAQQRWQQDHLFQQDSPYSTGEAEIPHEDFAKHAADLREKYPKVLATMPYPVSRTSLAISHQLGATADPRITPSTVHERLAPPRTRLLHLQDRVPDWL